jgi:hypothetical protein
MIPEKSKIPIQLRFIPVGTSFAFLPAARWALSACCELPLTTTSDDYTLTAGCTYVFK